MSETVLGMCHYKHIIIIIIIDDDDDDDNNNNNNNNHAGLYLKNYIEI
jgi:hypothetical protein